MHVRKMSWLNSYYTMKYNLLCCSFKKSSTVKECHNKDRNTKKKLSNSNICWPNVLHELWKTSWKEFYLFSTVQKMWHTVSSNFWKLSWSVDSLHFKRFTHIVSSPENHRTLDKVRLKYKESWHVSSRWGILKYLRSKKYSQRRPDTSTF